MMECSHFLRWPHEFKPPYHPSNHLPICRNFGLRGQNLGLISKNFLSQGQEFGSQRPESGSQRPKLRTADQNLGSLAMIRTILLGFRMDPLKKTRG